MKIKYYQNLGKKLNEKKRKNLIAQLRTLGYACFEKLPEYQCFAFDCDFKRHVIAIAYDRKKIVGFCSALKLTDEWGENFLHLGLTCVHPHYRGMGLTHKLAGRLTTEYLIRNSLFGKVWFSNVAGVISSLANVGKNLDQVYPSLKVYYPTKKHLAIAESINRRYRNLIYIGDQYKFDKEKFIFYGSGKQDSCFEKRSNDTKYHHRDPKLNQFYLNILNLDQGDEMLQVGNYSIFTLLRYLKK